VLEVLDEIPRGSWLEFRTLAVLAGLHVSYCRTFPTLIRARATALWLETGRVGKPGLRNANPFDGSAWGGDSLFDDVTSSTARGVRRSNGRGQQRRGVAF
jgi:hypothetical protein